jgi:hypothetical protein
MKRMNLLGLNTHDPTLTVGAERRIDRKGTLCHFGARVRRAMTLAEVLMALMITTLIVTTVTAALVAASYGTSSQRDWRRLAVKEYKARTLLQDSVGAARAVLASGTSVDGYYLVLWKGEQAAADNKVNLSELQLIEWDQGATTLSSWQAQTLPVPDTEYTAGEDFYQVASQAAQAGKLAETLWSDDVTAFEAAGDAAGSQAGMLTWTIRIKDAAFEESLVGVAALRQADPPE